jgi:RimJ/RimL family protein N-acetyltransferase
MMQIDTLRLKLRELTEEDLQAVHDYASDPEVVRYMPFGPNTMEDTKNFLDGAISRQTEEPRTDIGLGIELREDGRLIGACRINKTSEIEAHVGYILNRGYWGHGYASEAAEALVRFGFTEMGVRRIYADCHPDNVASIRVLEKIGMTLEGRRREYMMFHGEFCDTLLFAMLRHEWQGTQ